VNCPHCQKGLPENYGALYCAFCGKDLPPREVESSPVNELRQVSWPKFFAILFAPAVGCFLSLSLDVGAFAVLLGLIGSLVSGLICTRWIMEIVKLFGYKRALAHFGLAICLCSLSWFLCFLGCTGAESISNHGY
jgi:hypothetical protein